MTEVAPLFTGYYWVLLLLVVVFVALVCWFQLSDKRNGYDILDILKDGQTGKASMDAHVTIFMAMLAAWHVVIKTIRPTPNDATGGELVQILLIFLVYRVGKQIVQGYQNRPPALPALPDQIGQQVVVTPGVTPVVQSIADNTAGQRYTPPTRQSAIITTLSA